MTQWTTTLILASIAALVTPAYAAEPAKDEPTQKPMKMDEPMKGGMMKPGMTKGEVKKAAEQKQAEMKPMMEKEEKAMPQKNPAK
jgi:hypothetical protein